LLNSFKLCEDRWWEYSIFLNKMFPRFLWIFFKNCITWKTTKQCVIFIHYFFVCFQINCVLILHIILSININMHKCNYLWSNFNSHQYYINMNGASQKQQQKLLSIIILQIKYILTVLKTHFCWYIIIMIKLISFIYLILWWITLFFCRRLFNIPWT